MQNTFSASTTNIIEQSKSTSLPHCFYLCVIRLIEELTKELCSKEVLITELSGEKTTLTFRVDELEGQVQELSSSLLQKDKDVDVCLHFSSNTKHPVNFQLN